VRDPDNGDWTGDSNIGAPVVEVWTICEGEREVGELTSIIMLLLLLNPSADLGEVDVGDAVR
jgi:hypothetical protein